MNDARRTRIRIVIALVVIALVAIGCYLQARAMQEIERAANRRFGIASFDRGSIVDAGGEPIVVERARSRVIPEGAAFRIDGPDPIATVTVVVAPDPRVRVMGFELADRSADGTIVRMTPRSDWACAITDSNLLAADLPAAVADLPPPAPAAEVTISLESGRLRILVDGKPALGAPCASVDLRGAKFTALGGDFELLRIGALEDPRHGSDRGDSIPPVEVEFAPRRLLVPLVFALGCAGLVVFTSRRTPSRPTRLVAYAAVLAFVVAAIAYPIGSLGTPMENRRERGPDPVVQVIEDSLHLHAGNARRLEGPFLDFRCELRFATAWNSSLEVRMFGDIARGEDVITFRLATDPRLRTGFAVDEVSTGRSRPLGFDIEAFEANRLLDVTIESDAGLLRAYAVDVLADEALREKQRNQPVAEAFAPAEFRNGGPIEVRAMRGAMRLDRLAATPLGKARTEPRLIEEPRQAESRSRMRTVGAFVLAVAVIAASLRRGTRTWSRRFAVGVSCLGALPALAAIIEPPTRLGPLAAAVGIAPVILPMLAVAAIAISRSRRLASSCGVVLSGVAMLLVTFSRQDFDPQRSPLALGSEFDYLGRTYEIDLGLERHVSSRREIPWRRELALHGDVLLPRRPEDARTIVVLGDSRMLADRATVGGRSEFARRVEAGVGPGASRRGVRVVDATWERASLSAVLTFLDEVLLARPGREESRALSFAPDVALIVLPLGSLRAGRDADLFAASERDVFRGTVRAACDDASAVFGDAVDLREQGNALGRRFARIASAAASAGCRIVVASPIRGVELPIPAIVAPDGIVDLFFPTLPERSPRGALFHAADVLSIQGERQFSDVVARFLRKRVFTGVPK